MRKTILLFAILAAAMPLVAAAGTFDYTYAEGAFTSLSSSGNNSSSSGATVDGLFAIDPNWHVLGGVEHVSGENELDVGAGYNTALADNVDLFIEGEFLSTDVRQPSTDTGWGAIGGLRFQLAPKFELDGLVSHTDVSSRTENTIGVRGLLDLDKNWRLFASYSNNTDFDTFMIGVRYDF